MQAASTEDLGSEVELFLPVADDLTTEEAPGPRVHLDGYLGRDIHEKRVAVNAELETALVVERHGLDFAERVLAIEHPAVSAREQGISDVAQIGLDGRVGTRRGACALDPLATQVVRDLGALEGPIAMV